MRGLKACPEAFVLLEKQRDQWCAACECCTLEVPDDTPCSECGGETMPFELLEGFRSDAETLEMENPR